MKKWMMGISVLAIGAVMLVAGADVTSIKAATADTDTIADGIFIGDVNVGGMTGEEASDAVDAYMKQIAEETVTLTGNDVTLETTAAELGVMENADAAVEEAVNYGKTGNLIARYKAKKDLENENKVFPMTVTVDEDTVRAYLEAHADEINQEAVDYGLTRENGEFRIIDGQNGVELDIDASVDQIVVFYTAGWTENASIELTVQVTEPQGTEEELAKVQDVLGKYTTSYSGSESGRKQNLKTGCDKINGSVVYPGETFSVYEVASPFTAENGYALGGAYENGTTVASYGGGICQVSTTLYNAVIRAELEVVERYGHSMTVSYVDPSMDAAIAGTYKDFKFKNSTDAPIYIEGYVDGSNISFTVYGEETRAANREISFVSETTSTTEPTTEFRATSAAIGTVTKVQSSHTGKTARLWKIVTVDGVEQSREVFNTTTYKMSPNIYEVGTASENAEAVAAINAAIATNDLATIQAAAAQWNDAAVQAAAAQAAADAAAQAEAQAAADATADSQTTDSTGTTDNQTADTTGTGDTSQQTTDQADAAGTGDTSQQTTDQADAAGTGDTSQQTTEQSDATGTQEQ